MSIGKRLKKAIKDANIKMTDFSKKSGIPYTTIKRYIADDRAPSSQLMIKICKELHISADWLLTGQGEMYRTKPDPNKVTSVPVLEWLNKWWEDADEKYRNWLEVQMEKCFPEYAQWVKKISSKLHTSADWVLTDQGEMRQTQSNRHEIKSVSVLLEWFNKWWEEADEKHQHWLEVQMGKCFPEYAQWLKERSHSK
jgi:transcriptional regulator with XRE-family HTH domain